jgi:hypothetical protein
MSTKWSRWPPGLRRGSAVAYCWDFEFESCWGHGCLSVASAVCCLVEVSSAGRSLAQGSPTECVCYWVWSDAALTLYTYISRNREVRTSKKERKKEIRNLSILNVIDKDVLELMLMPFVSLDSSLLSRSISSREKSFCNKLLLQLFCHIQKTVYINSDRIFGIYVNAKCFRNEMAIANTI